MSASKYPLSWPEGWPRTPASRRQRSRYKLTGEKAREHLLSELRRMGATTSTIILSTNIVLRNDGQPYANQPKHMMEDPGVAVYWSVWNRFKDRVIACDKFVDVYDNIHACGIAIESFRAIDRCGASQVFDRAFQAFGELPASSAAPVSRPWWEIFGFPQELVRHLTLGMVEAKYRDLARSTHPDRGGSAGAMTELNLAIEQARKHFAR